jgi:hypothetical protein
MDVDSYVPDEPLPQMEDDLWVDVEEGTPITGEDLYQHYLEEHQTTSQYRSARFKLTPDYKKRIEKERENWKMQEMDLLEAYMELKVKGPLLEEEGEGKDWFSCKVYDLKGEL